MDEIWKAIPGFPAYEVSNHGQVRSYWKRARKRQYIIANEPQRILIPGSGKDGYLIVVLMDKLIRHTLYIHKLVLESFIGPCPPGMEACHNDGNHIRNFLINLRWDTPKENYQDRYKHGTHQFGENNPRAKLTAERVIQMRKLASQGYTNRNLMELFCVSYSHVDNIVHRRVWKHI